MFLKELKKRKYAKTIQKFTVFVVAFGIATTIGFRYAAVVFSGRNELIFDYSDMPIEAYTQRKNA